MIRLLFTFILSATVFFANSQVPAPVTIEESIGIDDIMCPNSKILGKALITDVCWEGMFPLYIGGFRVNGKSKYAPPDRNTNRLCFCNGDLSEGTMPTAGTAIGLFLPKYLLTVTSKPYCFPELNGTELASELGLVSKYKVGNQDQSNEAGGADDNQVSFTWHLAALPLTKILELFDVPNCFSDGYSSYDIIWISETLPMWYDDELAFFVAPESLLFANSLSAAGMISDCLASSTLSPIDSIFFAAGCWGAMYPLTANTGPKEDKVAAKSLIATRALFFLSRIGVMERTMGSDAVCKNQKMPIMKKSQYRFQQLWPLSESESMDVLCAEDQGCDATTASTTLGPEQLAGNLNSNNIEQIKINSLNDTCTHNIGESTFSWGVWRDAEQSSHASYLIFQWNDCCGDLIQFL
jgi:conjugal transfer pilus assembly protein TraU